MGFFSSVGDIFKGSGGNSLITGTVVGTDLLTGGWASDQMSKSSAKRQYKYNERLQDANMDFQKYMAENAHQMEMADLEAAGINPALTAVGSSAGSIAGKSASQGTSGGQIADLSGIVNAINSTRLTNADVELKKAQASLTRKETKQGKFGWLGEELGNDAINTIASPVRHIKKQWNSAKVTSPQRKNETKNEYTKRVWKNVLFDEQ